MTILQELVALYDARGEKKGWPKPGFSTVGVGAVVVLSQDGSVREIRSLVEPDAKGKLRTATMSVPAAVKRTAGVKPNIFWDKTAYALGVTETPDGPGQGKRTTVEHNAFKREHLTLLEKADTPALIALRRFCETWQVDWFPDYPQAAMLVDQNVVFKLGDGPFLHDLPDAQALLAKAGEGHEMCLVSGRRGAIARLHPAIKGVMGAQPSGASLVSFNNDAETSHGKKQGDNAPVSQGAAFAYGTALNALLAQGSGNKMRIGGDTVVFWADQPEAEDAFARLMSGGYKDIEVEVELRARLRRVTEGRQRSGDNLDPGGRLFVLGLAPNAARLAVRYWFPSTVGGFAEAITRFWDDMIIKPSPFTKDGVELSPKPWALLFDLAAQHDAANIPAGLGGDLMRAILVGGCYPATLLSTVIGRIRIEGNPDRARHGNVDGRWTAMIAAVLRRNYEQEIPMALDEETRDPAYLLGRLFGAYVYAERSYHERVGGLRPKYIGSASAMPARIFPVLMRGYEYNRAGLLKAGGMKAAAGIKADRAITAVIGGLKGQMPAILPLEAQGRFFVGFYHQTSAFYTKPEETAETSIEGTNEEGGAA